MARVGWWALNLKARRISWLVAVLIIAECGQASFANDLRPSRTDTLKPGLNAYEFNVNENTTSDLKITSLSG
jgi:hypothetical protein